ncbi:T9SS type A sorting domain-containing protein [Flavobacterium sp. BFFFF1]|uniref:T9SS type A sorting domain-containing protein n=1 Tax=Flavobacterium sp. BFFFF1 TaxID=2015557 RepID=UPI0025BE83A5|nr:T9SS type A sorting domain-containing protein [Flavobacterium sp. BFFFF1]
MQKKFFLLLLVYSPVFCQISFEGEKKLIEKAIMPYTGSEMISADFNGDNLNELVTTSLSEGLILLYQNELGDYTQSKPAIILQNQDEYPSGVNAIDIDSDGLKDLIFCNRYNNKMSWCKNLGNLNFSTLQLFNDDLNGPKSTAIGDVDNDGDADIIVNIDGDENISYIENNGDGTFQSSIVIFDTPVYDVNKIILIDLDNDGLSEVVAGVSEGEIYYCKNMGAGTFGPKIYLGYASNGRAFNFDDINGDNYPDMVGAHDGYYNKFINLGGNSFGNSELMFTTSDSEITELKISDIDNDGLTDIVAGTPQQLIWMKKSIIGDEVIFGPSQIINDLVHYPNYFIIDDIDNDGLKDVIAATYNMDNNSPTYNLHKTAALMHMPDNSFIEKLISFYDGAVFDVKIADMDGDGKKDIVSCYKSIVWNKNRGDAKFTSYKMISPNLPFPETFTYSLEIADIDNDGDADIIASATAGLEIYFNDGVGNFSLLYTLPMTYPLNGSRCIGIADLNGDGMKDIVLNFSSGNINLAWIPNINGTTFGNMINIDFTDYGFQPSDLICSDMDDDGDIDILVNSGEYSRLQWLSNDGTGVFQYHLLQSSITVISIALGDIDNDGDKDIIAAGGYYPGTYLIRNNGGVYAPKVLIQIKSADAIKLKDLNNDGLKDIVGVAVESSSAETIFYYLNNGNGFDSQVVVESENPYSGSRNFDIADINDDNRDDIVSSYYYSGKVSYFLNSSILSVTDNNLSDSGFTVYPLPFSNSLQWNETKNISGRYDVAVYTEDGRLIWTKNNQAAYLDTCFLNKGVYILKVTSENAKHTCKIVKN